MNRSMYNRWVWGVWYSWLAAMMLCGGCSEPATVVSVPQAVAPRELPSWDLPTDSPPPAIAPFDSELAKQHQTAWSEYLGVPVEVNNTIGMKFVLIPPGEFDIGSTEEEIEKLLAEARAENPPDWYIDRSPTEAPKHRVRITKAFYLGMTEVTQAQYKRVMGANPSNFNGDATRPVEKVSWNDAVLFCEKLGEVSGEQEVRAYRLPTAAEWEYACRAGTTTRWYGTDDEAALREQAWFTANSGGTTHPVGQKLPNAWGLYDMHGNVWEWCNDWYDNTYYANSPPEDPAGPTSGLSRVLRGGGWYSIARSCRSADRIWGAPDARDIEIGFRLAFSLVDQSGR